MESLPKDTILKFNKNTLKDVKKSINLDKPGEMKEAVNILEEWVKQQNHFKHKKFDRHYLEMTIILSKGSLERAKQRLDKACTLKNLMPDIFEEYDIKSDFFTSELKDITQAVLPKMTNDHCRVYLLKNSGKQFTSTAFKNYVRVGMMFGEYLRAHDYAISNHVIIDFTGCDLIAATSININDLRYFATMLIEGYGFRVKGIYILTPSKLVNLMVTLLKQVMSAKVGGRIQVHKHIDSIVKIIGKDVLPVDYGGNEKSLKKLNDEWFEVLSSKEHKEYLRVMNAARTDESLRPRDTFNEQYIGMPGTFRTLTVD